MNVMYTGNFSINWSYFRGMQPWKIYNLYRMQKYCENHDILLKVIDNSNPTITDLYEWTIEKSGGKADSWNLGTLTSMVAVDDFIQNKYDNFCWMDLDICITDMSTNIFDKLNHDFLLANVMGYKHNPKKEEFFSYFGLEMKRNCSSGIYLLSYDGARKFKNDMGRLGINIRDKDFMGKMVEHFKGSPHFISDECIVEALLNFDNSMEIGDLNSYIKTVLISPNGHRDYDREAFAYHFASDTKFLITDFWKHKGLL